MKATIEELNEWVEISEDSPSGLRWKKSPHAIRPVGSTVGGVSKRKNSTYYIFGLNYKVYYVHRVVYCIYHKISLDCKIKIDHADGNPLNNSISNLRIATTSENGANKSKCKMKTSSKYKGVHYNIRMNKWVARIQKNKITTCIGVFNNEVEAALAYNNKALTLFGDFARLNEI